MCPPKKLSYLYFLLSVGLLFSCNNTVWQGAQDFPATTSPAPATEQLLFDKPIKIDWANLPAKRIDPIIKKLDLAKIPATSYDTSGFKPFSKKVTSVHFDVNALPHKSLDISKVPSKPVIFKTTFLPAPKIIKGQIPHLKRKNNPIIFDFPDIPALNVSVDAQLIDKKGFLWVATSKGIYRYDGAALMLFMTIKSGEYINAMVEDGKGRIWLAQHGKTVFELLDPRQGIFQETNIEKKGNGFFFMDRKNRIWTTAINKPTVYIIDPQNDLYQALSREQGIMQNISSVVTQDKHGRIWIGGTKFNEIIDKEKNQITGWANQGVIFQDIMQPRLCDSKGRIWLSGLNGQLTVLDTRKGISYQTNECEASGNAILDLAEDSQSHVYVSSTIKGISIIDFDKRKIMRLTAANGLNDNTANSVVFDKQGQALIGTQGGLNMMGGANALKEQIGNKRTGTLDEDSNGLVWCGYFPGGIDIIDRSAGTVRHLGTPVIGNDTIQFIRHYDKQLLIAGDNGLDIVSPDLKQVTRFDKSTGLITPTLTSFIDSRKRIWFGGVTGAIQVYDPETHMLKTVRQKGATPDDGVLQMIGDRSGKIWILSSGGAMNMIDTETGEIKAVQRFKNAAFEVGCIDNSGNIWVGTGDGVYFINLAAKTITHLSTKQGLFENDILSIIAWGDTIYAASRLGISMINLHENKFNVKSYKVPVAFQRDGTDIFIADQITRDGLYWWGASGVTVFDLLKKDTGNVNAYVSAVNVMDERQYFVRKSDNPNADTSGFYNRGEFIGSAYRIPASLQWDSVGGMGYMPYNLHLSFNRNYVRLNYSSLNLDGRDSSWYRYILAGQDKTWSSATTETTSRNYFNLDAGDYDFKVSARNNDGTWAKPAVFSFTIDPPWWATWWARSLFVIFFVAVVWVIVYYRSQQLLRAKRLLEEKVKLRTKEVLEQKEEIASQRDSLEEAFTELKTTQTQLVQREKMASLGELTAGIAHEIQNPLNFVNNFSEVSQELMNELKDELDNGDTAAAKAITDDVINNLGKIAHHGRRADNIVKGMLEHSRTTTGQKEPTDLNKLADEYLRLAYHGLRAKDNVFNADMVIDLDEHLPMVNVIPQDIGRVMLNLFTNAFYAVNQKAKTAGSDYKPTVALKTALLDQSILITVKDNGTGIPESIRDKIMQPFFTTKPTGEGTGLGLSLSYDIVVKGHGGRIEVISKEGRYTEFIVELPKT